MSKSDTASSARWGARGRGPALLPGANIGQWSVLGAAVLWGTTGTAATFAPRGSSSLAVGAAAMGVGGAALFIGAGRSALRLITSRVASPALWLGAGCVIAYPLAFYTSMADAGVAIGVDRDPSSNEFPFARSKHCNHLRKGPASALIHTLHRCGAAISKERGHAKNRSYWRSRAPGWHFLL